MAHNYLNKLLSKNEIESRIIFLSSMLGIFFFVNAFIVQLVYNQPFYGHSLAFLAAFLLGLPLIYHALQDSRQGSFDMNELAAIGVLAAMATGDYYSASAISFFMIVSFYIEHRSAKGAQLSIESLMNLTPLFAIKIINSEEKVIPIKDLKVGDMIKVRPGDRIPADGRIESGESEIDQSSITGESQLIFKEKGEEVYGGTINISSVLNIRIFKVGEDTAIGKVKQLIMQARESKTPVERLINQYAKWYTPFILLLSGMVLFFSRDIQRAISMLVIACPCSILLSSPAAVVASLTAASRLGLFIKNISDLEIARKVTAVLFDKTGTLTTGKLHITGIYPNKKQLDENKLLILSAALAHHSNHPISRAIVKALPKNVSIPTVNNFKEVPGKGIEGKIDNSFVSMGRHIWLKDQGVEIPEEELSNNFTSDIHISIDHQWIGRIEMNDHIRPNATQVIDHIKQMKISHVIMITGDRHVIAQKISKILHCTDVISEAFPDEKVRAVRELQENGHTVAVIGDGINDAPALAAGDISIAMSTKASDIAIDSASVALLNDQLNRIPYLFQLSEKTVRVIRQNIFLSISCIILFLIFSAAGYIHPVLAALLHSLNAIFVILNSARLIRSGENLDSNH